MGPLWHKKVKGEVAMSIRMYKMILALLLFCMIFCFLGLPYTEWGFRTDAWSFVYNCIIKRWSDIGRFFTENIEDLCLPSNGVKAPAAFFSVLYRPLWGFVYYAQYCLWGANPYGYFLCIITLHALLSVILFYLFSYVTTIGWAFFCAALFGFHSSLWDWMGWVSAQLYVIEGFVFVGVLVSLHRYFLTQRYRWYITACACFMCSLFLREQLVFLPFWLVCAFPFYHTFSAHNTKTRSFFTSLPMYVRQASGFFVVMFFYLFVRISLFPVTRETKTLTFAPTFASFVSRMTSRIFDFVTYGVDMMGLTWVPSGTMWAKGILGTAVIGLFLYALYNSTQKRLIIFLLVSIPFFSWPALVMHHKGRYLYVALMFVMAIIAFLSASHKGAVVPIRRMAAFSLGCFLAMNMLFLVREIKSHEQEFSVGTKALVALAKNLPTNNRPLCFLALPPRLFANSTAQAIWLLRPDFTQPIYQYDTCACCDSKVLAQNPVFITWDYERAQFMIMSPPMIPSVC